MMLNWPALMVGFILTMVLTIIGGLFGLYGSFVGVLIAGIFIGYMINGDILRGMVHGALISALGMVVLGVFALFIGYFSVLFVLYMCVVTIESIVFSIMMGTIGGALGSVCREMI